MADMTDEPTILDKLKKVIRARLDIIGGDPEYETESKTLLWVINQIGYLKWKKKHGKK